MLTFLELLQAKQAPKAILSDCHYYEHLGTRFTNDSAIYDYTPTKGNGRKHFESLKRGDKIVSLRRNADWTVTAITFIFDGLRPQTPETIDVTGAILSSVHYDNQLLASKDYPEAFDKGSCKFKTGVCITTVK